MTREETIKRLEKVDAFTNYGPYHAAIRAAIEFLKEGDIPACISCQMEADQWWNALKKKRWLISRHSPTPNNTWNRDEVLSLFDRIKEIKENEDEHAGFTCVHYNTLNKGCAWYYQEPECKNPARCKNYKMTAPVEAEEGRGEPTPMTNKEAAELLDEINVESPKAHTALLKAQEALHTQETLRYLVKQVIKKETCA